MKTATAALAAHRRFRTAHHRVWIFLMLAVTLNPAVAQETEPEQAAIESRIRALELELQLLKQAVTGQPTPSSTDAKLDELDRKIQVVERKQEVANEEAAVRAKPASVVSAGQKGFSIASSDGAFNLRLRSLIQADGRFYINSNPSDTFLIRRARLELTGTLFKQFDFRLMEDFAGSNPTLMDAWLDWKISPQFQVLAGKVKMPVGLERVQSRENNLMDEFGYPTNLAPNRAVGLAIHGGLWDANVDYFLGAYNWAPDGASSMTSASGDVNLVARLFATPFSHGGNTALHGLGFGIGGSYGVGAGSPSNYASVGQQTFFRWRSGVAVDGETWRLVPQAYYFSGPFGLLGEYAVSSQTVTSGAGRAVLKNQGWEVTASWLLSGEDSTFKGVNPLKPVNFGESSNWGAWQLVLRVTDMNLDDDAFPVYADPAISASRARSYGAGLNWYLNTMLRFSINYNWTAFHGASLKDENSLFTRFQFRY